ncbi:hypothetical protein [Pseudomonas sp. ACM7]|uniref:hypothetical protein n=1 Tax=Pseudomonas sp. ACM7 TaxID=2052956 RepID=UPI0026B61D89
MPPISTRLVALFVLCLTLVVPAQANACPAGEKQVCLDDCICLPDLGQVLGPRPDRIYKIAAPVLALWLSQARAEAATAGTQPIPPKIREQLLRCTPPAPSIPRAV